MCVDVTNVVSMVLLTIVTGTRATAPEEEDELVVGHPEVLVVAVDVDVDPPVEVEVEVDVELVDVVDAWLVEDPPTPAGELEPQAENTAAAAGARRAVRRMARRERGRLSSMASIVVFLFLKVNSNKRIPSYERMTSGPLGGTNGTPGGLRVGVAPKPAPGKGELARNTWRVPNSTGSSRVAPSLGRGAWTIGAGSRTG
jgi:hypothetical protein